MGRWGQLTGPNARRDGIVIQHCPSPNHSGFGTPQRIHRRKIGPATAAAFGVVDSGQQHRLSSAPGTIGPASRVGVGDTHLEAAFEPGLAVGEPSHAPAKASCRQHRTQRQSRRLLGP